MGVNLQVWTLWALWATQVVSRQVHARVWTGAAVDGRPVDALRRGEVR